MTEHEKLKFICDKIWYKNKTYFFWKDYIIEEEYNEIRWVYNRNIDVREIIFTQEFIEKMIDYVWANIEYPWNWNEKEIMEHLDNPVEYIYKLIK